MAKYQEVPISGSQWIQLGKAKFLFSINKPTQVVFNEEKVVDFNNKKTVEGIRDINLILDTPTTKFVLVDPDTNLPTGGDMSYKQLERAVYSLYYAEAVRLDTPPPS